MYDGVPHQAGCCGGSQILTCSSRRKAQRFRWGAKCVVVTRDACVRAGGIIYPLIGGIEAAAQGREIRCPQGMRLAISRAGFNKSLKLCNLVKQQMSGRPFLDTAHMHPFAI